MVGISVVVPEGNGRAFLTKALKGLRQQTKEYHYLWPIQGTRRCGAGLSVFDEGSPTFPDQDDFWHRPFLFQTTAAVSRDSSQVSAVCNGNALFPSGEKYGLYQTKFPSLRLPKLPMLADITTPSHVRMRLSSFWSSGWGASHRGPSAATGPVSGLSARSTWPAATRAQRFPPGGTALNAN